MSNKTILFADDSATMRTIMEKTFTAEPFEVVTVPSGEAAINQAKTMRPDIIVVDAGMAGVSGYDVCQAIRNDSDIKSIPLVMMSGVSNLYDENRGASVGVTQHVKKPFDTGQLIELVTTLSDKPVEAVAEEEIAVVPAAPEPISSLESLSEPPLEPISIAPDDAIIEEEAAIPEVEVEPEEAPEIAVDPVSEPIPLAKPEPAVSISSTKFDDELPKVGTGTQEFVRPASFEEKPAAPASVSSIAGDKEESPYGEVALDVEETESTPQSPDVAPIELEAPKPDTPSASFQVGTLAELAQMDGRARPLSPESTDDAIEIADTDTSDDLMLEAHAKVAAKEAEPPMTDVVDAARDRMDVAAKDVAANVEGITVEQADAIQTLTREVIERVVWEVVPDLAEVIIKEELKKLLEE